MNDSMQKTMRYVLGSCGAALLLVGCRGAAPSDAEKKAPVVPVVSETPTQVAGAKQTFDMHCAKCHPLGGETSAAPGAGGPKGMMRKGPDLAKVAADPKHTKEWFLAYVRDPQAQNPKSRMPKFEGKLDDGSLSSLADFLLSAKKPD
jgi:mono/diheme cytochrome c family protein